MPANYAGNPASYPANIACPVDADPPNAAATTTPLQQLADRTAFLASGTVPVATTFNNGITVAGGAAPQAAVKSTGGGIRPGGTFTGGPGGADGVQGIGTSSGAGDGGAGVSATGHVDRAALHLTPQAQPSGTADAEGDIFVINAGTKLLRVFLNAAWHTVGLLNRAQTWVEQTFTSGTAGVAGVTATGNGTAPGAVFQGGAGAGGDGAAGTGGATAGSAGLRGTGGTAGGAGVVGVGTGTLAGGDFSGAARGVNAVGAANADAVHAVTSGTGTGVFGSCAGGTGLGGRFLGNTTRSPIQLDPLAAAPSTPTVGEIYYNATLKHFYGCIDVAGTPTFVQLDP